MAIQLVRWNHLPDDYILIVVSLVFTVPQSDTQLLIVGSAACDREVDRQTLISINLFELADVYITHVESLLTTPVWFHLVLNRGTELEGDEVDKKPNWWLMFVVRYLGLEHLQSRVFRFHYPLP